jgi:hypothetical protein
VVVPIRLARKGQRPRSDPLVYGARTPMPVIGGTSWSAESWGSRRGVTTGTGGRRQRLEVTGPTSAAATSRPPLATVDEGCGWYAMGGTSPVGEEHESDEAETEQDGD